MVLPASIDTLRSTLGKRQGVARPNRFSIYMPLPLISINPGSILTNIASGGGFNPMSLLNDPRDISLLCESCTLPGRQIATTEHMTRLKFLLTNDYYIKQVFDDWTNKVIDFDGGTVNYKDECVSDVTIQQLGPDNIPIYTCTLRNAFPVTVSSVELSNTSENAIARISVTMAYDEWGDGASLAGTILGIVANKLLS